jgi:hypothetical protein
MRFTVMTGDVVGSSGMTAGTLDDMLESIECASREIAGWDGPDSRLASFARRGGDAWQAAFPMPDRSLRASLCIRACLRRMDKAFDTRIAVAADLGTVPPDGDLNRAHGPAFTASGRLLDALPGPSLMSHAAGGAKAAALILADQIASGWTEAQARAVAEMLPPGAGPRAEAASRLNISRQAVDQALHAASFPALAAAFEEWEQTERRAFSESGP